ncbi:hypothetical protein C8Q77DRAFT_1082049 [Trametes polyzona]|nr:hypothetical protein C8Q77DRAFT_1082049 [Trametes polyzona]
MRVVWRGIRARDARRGSTFNVTFVRSRLRDFPTSLLQPHPAHGQSFIVATTTTPLQRLSTVPYRPRNMSPPASPTVSACSLDSVQTAPRRLALGQPSTRKRLVPAQTSALVSVFEVKTHPTREERALLAAELGMELKAVNAWFQNKRRTLKKNCSGCGWSKGSLPENKHVRPANGLKSLPRSESPISLERVASSHELPYKPKPLHAPRAPTTPRRRAGAEVSKEIWEYLPSSPPTRPSSPGHTEPLLSLSERAKRARSLEWACAKARVGRKKAAKGRPANPEVDSEDELDLELDDGDVPMLILDGIPREKRSVSGNSETDTEEEEEAITPNVSTEMLPPFVVSPESGMQEPGKDVDMEAAMALLRFMAPKA